MIPIIRCPKGNAAEAISQRLESKLRDYCLNSRGATSYTHQERPGLSLSRTSNISHDYSRPKLGLDPHDISQLDSCIP